MRSKLLIPSVLVAALGVGACGSSSSSSSSTSASTPGAPAKKHGTKHHKKAKHSHRSTTRVASRTYRLKLSGKAETPRGAPKGAGKAVIALHGSSDKVCWRFSHLHGFTSATFAHIHKGSKGKEGPVVVPLSTSTKLHHAGCAPASAALIKAIEKNPHAYYVNIHSKKYPGGAVRSQL